MTDNELFGISEQLNDTISRAAAINAICEDGTQLERQGQYTMTMAERKQRDADILDALPSAQPSATDTNVATTDSISRRDAIEAMAELQGKAASKSELLGISKAWKRIKALPSAQPEEPSHDAVKEYCRKRCLSIVDTALLEKYVPSAQQWISVTERLPEDCTDVLVWFEYFRYGDYNRLYQMHGIGNYMSKYDSWMINHETGWRELRVFAWMPLPEPYKEHDDD